MLLPRTHEEARKKATTINPSCFRIPLLKNKNPHHQDAADDTFQQTAMLHALPWHLNARKDMLESVRLLPFLPWRSPCGSFLHLLMSSWSHGAGGLTAEMHLEPTKRSTLICVSLAPVLLSPSLHRARTHAGTERRKRERADAQPIFTKIAALCI